MTGNRRRVLYTLVCLFVAAAAVVGVLLVNELDETVARRRAINAAALAEAETEARRVSVRICDEAINGNRSDLASIIARLTAASPPPADEAEAEQRAIGQRILDDALAHIDCEVYVDTGVKVPKA